MSWVRLGRQLRAIRLRSRLRQVDVAELAHVSRSAVSLIERGRADRLTVRVVESVVAALGPDWMRGCCGTAQSSIG